MEVAYLLRKLNKNLEIVVLDKNEVPFQKILGKEVGNILKDLHLRNGIKLKLERKVSSIVDVERENYKLKKIYLEKFFKEESTEEDNFIKKKEQTRNKIDYLYGDMVIFATGEMPNNVLIILSRLNLFLLIKRFF